MTKLHEHPDDARLRVEVAEGIGSEAERLPDDQRARVNSELMRASFGGGVSALDSAYRALTASP